MNQRYWMPLAVVMLFAAFVMAADEPAKPVKARTYHDTYAESLAHNKRTLLDAYLAHGKRDAGDEPAQAFLRQMVYSFSAAGCDLMYVTEPAPSRDELIVLGQRARDAGNRDPIVLYCLARCHDDNGNTHVAVEMLKECISPLLESDYPSIRKLSAANRLRERVEGEEEKLAITQVGELALKVMEELDKQDDPHLRILVNDILDSYTTSLADPLEFLAAAEKQPKYDRWSVLMMGGIIHTDLAWRARGSGWANTVTDEGWAKFHDHLGQAKKYLVAAHELRPDRPEAATRMITVAMGAGERLGDNPVEWFDKAIAAQLDYVPAMERVLNALLPRWGGSYPEMLAVAQRCASSERYDTEGPWMVIRALDAIARDSERGLKILENATFYEAFDEVLKNYVEYNTTANRLEAVKYQQSLRAAGAWRAKRYGVAAGLTEKLGDQLDPAAFRRLGAESIDDAIGESLVRSGKDANAFDAARRLIINKNYVQGLAALTTLRDAAPADSRERRFYERYLASIERGIALDAGAPVLLMPPENLDGWRVVVGKWTAKDNLVTAEAGNHGAILAYGKPLTGPLEISYTIHPDRIGTRAGIAFVGPNGGYTYVLLERGLNIIRVWGQANAQIKLDKQLPLGGMLSATVDAQNRVTIAVDGQTYASGLDIGFEPGEAFHFGYAAGWQGVGEMGPMTVRKP